MSLPATASRAALLLVLLLPQVAAAFSITVTDGLTSQVNRWNLSRVAWRQHVDCAAGMDLTECQKAVAESFAAWTGHSCSSLVFDEGANTDNLLVAANGWAPNGENEVVWVEDSTWLFGSFVLANTSQLLGDTGLIEEVDIAFNGFHHTWSATPGPGVVAIQNTAVHEIGHLLGLAHNLTPDDPNDPPTMAVYADESQKSATLHPDDIAGLCFLVPKTQYTCATDADCPDVIGFDGGNQVVTSHFSCWNSGFCEGYPMTITGDPPVDAPPDNSLPAEPDPEPVGEPPDEDEPTEPDAAMAAPDTDHPEAVEPSKEDGVPPGPPTVIVPAGGCAHGEGPSPGGPWSASLLLATAFIVSRKLSR